jgi:aspartyl-tRNA(Asn)/glutamyl-tRNA(Gln) amidotransferase subunit A
LPAPIRSDPLAHGTSLGTAPALRDDSLKGVRLGLVEAHVPREKMTREAVAVWDRALADLRDAARSSRHSSRPVTLTDYRRAFTDAEHARADVAGNSRSPAATANALYRYFAAAPAILSTPCGAATAPTDPSTTCCQNVSKTA